jgi:hypothetical protein
MTTAPEVRIDTEEPAIYVLRKPGSTVPTFAEIDDYEAFTLSGRGPRPTLLHVRRRVVRAVREFTRSAM